jgi:small GTP-binding protein
LGILAHVDAGKTTLTERLLYGAGVIDAIGSVDRGTTQTDSLELERRRGITIKAAVVSFAIGDVKVNLIDTPGHPDFIAEVERVLGVLDGAVLVISAVEGVQSQTPVLMRALQRLRIPALLFVNKTDRPGADVERVVKAIAERLTPAVVPMGSPRARLVEALAERDDALLAAYVDGRRDDLGHVAAACARRADGKCGRPSGALRVGPDRRRRGRPHNGDRRAAPRARRRRGRPCVGKRVQGRPRRIRRAARLRPDVLRDDPRPRSRSRSAARARAR